MPRKSWSIGGGIGALALITVVIALQGCDGNSSPSGNFLAACETGCNKEAACLDASSPNAKSFCVSSCTTANSLMTAQNCPNLSTQINMANACIAMPICTNLEACLSAIPGCPTDGGAGGSTGGDGNMGSGGSAGVGGRGN